MITMPTIDMAATGMNITRLRINAGLSVKDLADIFGFATPQAVYKWQCQPWIIWWYWRQSLVCQWTR